MIKAHNRSLSENSLLFVICSCLLSQDNYNRLTVLYMVVSIIILGLLYLAQKRAWKYGLFLFFLALIYFWTPFWWFLPVAFGLFLSEESTETDWAIACVASAGVLFIQQIDLLTAIVLVAIALLATYLNFNRQQQEQLTQDYLRMKDDSYEQQRLLEEKNSELVSTQEAAIQLEIIQERNRIAHDIHDNVGHLLSRALIQLGAIQTINQQENLKKPLTQLHDTVDQGMNSIRVSVHKTFNETLDFTQSLDALIRNFSFCEVVIEGDPQMIQQKHAQDLLMAIQEAFSNIMKHSNATKVTVTFSELPGFYKCVVQDNGTGKKQQASKGIGLAGMQQRLQKTAGQLHILAKEDSFTLNIILPKEEKND